MPKVICFILLISFLGYGQKAEVGAITENDSYISLSRDQYYTNGLELFYRRLIKNNSDYIIKKMIEFKIGQYIYNPQTTQAYFICLHDRPFAGYLFTETGISNFYKDESVLKLNAQIGILGPYSMAEPFQKAVHHLAQLGSIFGWEYQIKNTIGIQTSSIYSKKILTDKFCQNIDIQMILKADIGTIWTGMLFGTITRLSIIELLPIFDSNLYGASLNEEYDTRRPIKEFYLYFTPNLNYQLYDATIQGSLFNKNSPVTFDIKPFRFIGEIGLKYRYNRLNLSYSFIYKTKELVNKVVTDDYYGSIGISYLLGN